jgi:hypothetical protein
VDHHDFGLRRNFEQARTDRLRPGAASDSERVDARTVPVHPNRQHQDHAVDHSSGGAHDTIDCPLPADVQELLPPA